MNGEADKLARDDGGGDAPLPDPVNSTGGFMDSKESQLREWLKEIIPFGKMVDGYCLIKWDESYLRARLFTKNYIYQLAVATLVDYLGATMVCRLARAGEDWLRGRDLPDGTFSTETWNRIKNAIISNELVRVIGQRENINSTRSPVLTG